MRFTLSNSEKYQEARPMKLMWSMSRAINLLSIVAVIFSSLGAVQAAPAFGSRTLVIYDQRLTEIEDFSIFLSGLKTRSFQLSYSPITNTSNPINLFRGEDRLYDNLILFPIKARHFNKQVSATDLLQYFESGGNIFAVSSPDGLADSLRLFLNQLGIFPSPRNYYLGDYLQAQDHNTIQLSSSNVLNDRIAPSTNESLTYKGSAALLSNRDLIVPILKAPKTSFTRDTQKGGEDWTVGSQGYVAAGFQNLHNSRLVWTGSDSFLSDKFATTNGQFVQELAKWVFGEKAIIKSVGAGHAHANGVDYSAVPYKVKDDIVYEIGLSEWNGQSWVPFVSDDIQFELRMIDPYYRLSLKPIRSTSNAQYYTSGNVTLPDHHGIFTFQVDYRREGLSFLTETDVKAIRHLANDEYLRSWDITNSWVYLTSIYSVIAVWAVFVVFYLSINQKIGNITMEKKKN